MTTRSQKRKALAELLSGDLEDSVAQNSQTENLVARPSKSLKKQAEKLDEIKTSLRKEIMSDLTNVLAEIQREVLKLIVRSYKTNTFIQNMEDC